MKFGKVPEQELDSINLSLPPEPPGNRLVLPGRPMAGPRVYIGCANRGVKEWIGKLYPKGTKDAGYLDQYVKHFNSIEFNATHYQIYDEETIGRWAAKAAGHDFLFCPKLPQSISHYSGFGPAAQEQTNAFFRGILAFGQHLGPVFIQVSERYSPQTGRQLFQYLETLPTDLTFFLEVRHPDWFVDGPARKDLFDTLRRLKIGAVITDVAGRRDCAHMELTIPKAFIRYVGNSMHPTDAPRMDAWVERMKYWLDNGLEEIYYFMHTKDEILAPEMISYLVDRMNPAFGMQLEKPIFIQRDEGAQISLF
ncbi:MAG: DUF72 domain-containing protein [Candidatus Pseudobacter hemicellulosilyticus]|uniref:DUF72 domain-containing protein n=1 Tax=Candidatus Pseudobacter hemicellulosilyticus TaxID=3121375 RepID=A0AAJ6BIS4_9BACT|nr:MAG: DUF72 domain-containing protein [Pseudobacter sp.]